MARRVELRSPLDPVTAATRLRAAVGDRIDASTPQCVTGHGTENDMTLWVHRPRVRNDFKTVFTADMVAEGSGTRIDGRIGRARAVTIFMIAWIGFVALFAAGGLAMLLAGAPSATALPFTLIPLGMLGFAAALLTLGGWHARGDEQAILAFLAATIDARP